jgi:hypothetical protein
VPLQIVQVVRELVVPVRDVEGVEEMICADLIGTRLIEYWGTNKRETRDWKLETARYSRT